MPDCGPICTCGLYVLLAGGICECMAQACLRYQDYWPRDTWPRRRSADQLPLYVPGPPSYSRPPSYTSRASISGNSGYRSLSPMLHDTRGRQGAGETTTQRSRSLPAATPNLQQHSPRGRSASRASEPHSDGSRGRLTSRTPFLRQ